MPPDLHAINRILIVKLSSLGDVVHATPCLAALRARFPRARIFWAIERSSAAAVRHHPDLDGLIEVDVAALGKVGQFFAIRRTLAAYPRFDLALDLQGTLRSAAWVYLSRARVRAGRGGFRPGWQRSVRPNLERHAVEVCAEVLESLGIAVEDRSPRVHCSPTAEVETEVILTKHDLPSRGFLLLNPFSRWRSKEWPMDRWAALIERLWNDGRVPTIITGSPSEAAAARDLARMATGKVVSLAGELSLDHALCLYRRAGMMVTGDSGPMHLAAALGTPLVALFGPTHPERTGPWGQLDNVLQARRPARHHAYRADRAAEYMCALDVETVYQAVRRRWLSLPPSSRVA